MSVLIGPCVARFHAAEVCLALKFLHENGVLYRDMKLDDIMLASDGHVKLVDFGHCKKDMWHGSTTGTFCGNMEFMAPEVRMVLEWICTPYGEFRKETGSRR